MLVSRRRFLLNRKRALVSRRRMDGELEQVVGDMRDEIVSDTLEICGVGVACFCHSYRGFEKRVKLYKYCLQSFRMVCLYL